MKRTFIKFLFSGLLFLFLFFSLYSNYPTSTKEISQNQNIVNEITQFHPVQVIKVYTPVTEEEIKQIIKAHSGSISIGGGRYSMGGQVSYPNSIHLDMRQFNKILKIDPLKKQIVVQSGATWREIIRAIDPFDLSVKIMQSYSNFTVGGSLSVNVHGRYIGEGPIISSVENFKIILSSGEEKVASRTENTEIFYGAIGGYGGLGVITEVTLQLGENFHLERVYKKIPLPAYKDFFFSHVRNNQNVILENGDLLPKDFEIVSAVSYQKTDKPLTETRRLSPEGETPSFVLQFMKWIVLDLPYGESLRPTFDEFRFDGDQVVTRNFEASYDVSTLSPISTDTYSFVLQEYFIPVDRINDFVNILRETLNRHDVDILNVSIRHAKPDPGTLLAWAREEVFAFVLYYRQERGEKEQIKVNKWGSELIDGALSLGGSYYLPYQLIASKEQFHKAYPLANKFFSLKDRLDPDYKFRNSFFDAYYRKILG